MKRILMRSSMHPLKAISAGEAITQDVMNGNTGNMIFAHSIARALMQEDTVLDVTKTKRNFSRAEVEKINAEYDCFVIPLANAFRPNFQDDLDFMTRLIKKLKIPCIVIGVGVQAKIDESVTKKFEFDDASTRFIKAVLEKSAMIGVRGEITAEYMKKLGFREEKDFTVIGCPSMYLHGDTVPLKTPVDLTPKSKVSVNRKINIPPKLHQFIYDASLQFEDAMFVPQGIDDLLLLYAGKFIDRSKYPKMHETYPWKMDSEICGSGHEIGFTNVPSWMDFLSQRDFSFGSRIHGNITAVMSGTPAYIFAPDSRILELARYHNIQHMPAKDITDTTNIFDVYEKADFTSVQKGHKERFCHYLDFLEANGLDHAFGPERTDHRTAFDKQLEALTFPGGVTALNLQDLKEQSDRMYIYYKHIMDQYGSIHNLERYAKMEKALLSLLNKTPRGLKQTIKKSMKRITD